MDPTNQNNIFGSMNPTQTPIQSLPSNTSAGSGIDWGGVLGNLGGLYGAGTTAANSQGLINAGNAGFGMASNAYNPSLFGMNGVGGSGFSLTSPNGGPGSISSSLGAFNPMYGAYAGGANQYLNNSLGLANTASTGATGAYNTALSSIMPQLQQMQNNLLSANQNALFQRGQLGSGSFGQNTAGGPNNPVNLTAQSLGSGFAQQDLNAIQLAQNQGLNFFNSNLAGASGLGNLGLGTTNTGLGFIGAQNATGQLPLAYSQLYGGQQLGATNANANTIGAVAGRNGINLGGGYGGLASGIGGGLSGLGGLFGGSGAPGQGGIMNNLSSLYNNLFGGGGNNLSSYLGGLPSTTGMNAGLLSGFGDNGAGAAANDILGNYNMGSDLSGLFGPSAAGGEAAGLAPAGAGVSGSMLMPSMLPSSYGTAAIGTAADTTGMSDIGAITAADPTAGAAAGGLGSVSPMVGAAAAAIPLAIAAHQNPTALSQNYWNGINSTLAAGPGSGQPQWGSAGALNPIAQNTQYQGALADIANTLSNQGQGNSTIPTSEWQTLAQYGITPQSMSSYNDAYSQAAANMPALMAANDAAGIPNYSTPSRQRL